jgi:hypothetical protein
MVLLRMFVEIAMMVILIGIPIVMLCMGRFQHLTMEKQIVFAGLAVICACVLPWYGFITWQVRADLLGLTFNSLFKKQSCDWSEVKALARVSTFNWLRYVIETAEQGPITFPVLMKDCDQLVEEIRQHLPAGGGPARRLNRTFDHDQIASFMYFAQILYGAIFIAITWTFFNSLHTKAQSDSLLMLAFCIVVTGVLIWRSAAVALMPRRVQVTPDSVLVRTYFFQKSFPFSDLLKIKKSLPFLPDGFMIQTKSGTYLVGANMNSADELQQLLLEKLPRANEPD